MGCTPQSRVPRLGPEPAEGTTRSYQALGSGLAAWAHFETCSGTALLPEERGGARYGHEFISLLPARVGL